MNIDSYKTLVHNTLEQYFLQKSHGQKYCKNMWDSMSYTTLLGGKRLRAIFCLETCRILCGDYLPALPAACAIEMLHAQSLIHDDLPCMDNDDLRRGKPSNHKVFGEAMAVLSGDALISFGAQTIIEKTKAEPQTVLDVVNTYLKSAGAMGIVAGQCADIEAENANFKVADEHLEYIHQYKTAALFECAFICGALLGGANEVQMSAIKEYAQTFGLAFQIYDDIIDVISTTEELGKTAGKDAKNNKTTYATKYGLENAKQKLAQLVLKSYDILDKVQMKSDIFVCITQKMREKVGV